MRSKPEGIKQGSFIGKSKGRQAGLLRDERDARARVPGFHPVIYGLAARVITGLLHQRGTRARVPGLERHPRSGWRGRGGGNIRVRLKKLGVQNTPLCTLFLHTRLFSQTSGSVFFRAGTSEIWWICDVTLTLHNLDLYSSVNLLGPKFGTQPISSCLAIQVV